MTNKTILITGSTFAGLGVALGAFGAHALKPILLANNRVDVYETAVRYQLFHALALLLIGVLMGQLKTNNPLGKVAGCWMAGIILFSGSLYGLSLTSIRWVVYATPVGGLFFLAGWVILVITLIQHKNQS